MEEPVAANHCLPRETSSAWGTAVNGIGLICELLLFNKFLHYGKMTISVSDIVYSGLYQDYPSGSKPCRNPHLFILLCICFILDLIFRPRWPRTHYVV